MSFKNDTWGSWLKFLFHLCHCETWVCLLYMCPMHQLYDTSLLWMVPLLYLCQGWWSCGCFLIGCIKCLDTKCSCEFKSSYKKYKSCLSMDNWPAFDSSLMPIPSGVNLVGGELSVQPLVLSVLLDGNLMYCIIPW